MARKSELTQDLVNKTADELHSKGVKPSPNNVREVLKTGSYSTIKKMLDSWKERQDESDAVFIPDTPEFVYRMVDKLHKELYFHNWKLLHSERQQLEVSRQEIEAEKSEMLLEINHLEQISQRQDSELSKKSDELITLNTTLDVSQKKLEQLISDFNDQKIKIATLTERDKQQVAQLKEKESLLIQSEQQQVALTQHIEALMKKLSTS